MKALVFSAHPDDAEFGMGGTLVKLARKHDVVLCTMTDGGAGTHGDAQTRKQEAQNAADQLGATLDWQGRADCSLEHDKQHTYDVANIIRKHRPDAIFAPHWDQQGGVLDGKAHPEHRIMGLLVKDAARYARFGIDALDGEKHKTTRTYYYMVPQHRQAKILVGIDDAIDELKKLWACHESQLALKDGQVREYLLEARKRRASNHPDVTHAEAFDADEPVLADSHVFFEAL